MFLAVLLLSVNPIGYFKILTQLSISSRLQLRDMQSNFPGVSSFYLLFSRMLTEVQFFINILR